MEVKLEKRYGLLTAICMVVGIVVGSGVFFKAEAVLNRTGGNMALGIAAWLIVGFIMIACVFTFSTLSSLYAKVSGAVDYAEVALGPKYGYFVGWFMAIIYYPSLTSVLAWLSARYLAVLLGWDITGGSCMTIAAFFLCMDYAMNALAPRISGKFQVSTTAIKMVPLALMAVVGTIVGIGNGRMAENFATMASGAGEGGGLMGAAVAVAFAYEGWILATSINAELKDAKKNLPLALVLGSFIVVATYILYYIGLNGAVTTEELMASGEAAAKMAFQRVFGETAGTLVFVLIVISCLGTLNGLMLSCCRCMYSLAARGQGPKPEMFRQVDPATNMPSNSAILSLGLDGFWLLYFYGANLTAPWFGSFSFDSSELPIVTLYAMYIPMFIMFIVKSKELNGFKRFVMPVLGLCGCVFMVYAAFAAYGKTVCFYIIVYLVIMAIGNLFYRKQA